MEEMNTKMLSQLRSAPSQIAALMEKFSFRDIEGLIPADQLKKIRTVILTGCGGEFYTAAAAKPVFENKENFKGTGMYPGVETFAMSAIEFSRYYCSYLGWHPQRKDKHLIVSVDKAGDSSRIAECAMRANSVGSTAVTITARSESPRGNAAEYLLTPPVAGEDNPFFWHSCALYSALLMGMQMGMAKGLVTPESAQCSRNALVAYVESCSSALEAIEKQSSAITEKWHKMGIKALQIVAAGQDFATAGWSADLMIRTLGMPVSLDDLEGWCHVDIFTAPNARIGCIVVANAQSPSFSRAEEVVQCMLSLGRQVVVLTDSDKVSMPTGADVIVWPRCTVTWGAPMMQHLPMGFLAAHMARLTGRELRTMDADALRVFRINSSKIEIC